MLRAAARSGLAAATAYGLGGCGIFDGGPEPPAPTPDPLRPLLTGALELAARYEAAIAAYPQLTDRLTAIRDAHRAHADALARLIGAPTPLPTDPSDGPTPAADPKATLAALRAAEQDGRAAATQACLDAPAGRAALVGSIAAARASHAEVLR